MSLTKTYLDIEISKIQPYKNNNKIHTKKDINEVAKSIKKNSDLAPMIIDENNILIVGHGRLEAFKKLKYKTVKVLKVTGLSEKQKKDYRIRDNTTNLLSDFNFENIQKEIASLGEDSYDLLSHIDWLDGFEDINFLWNEEYDESKEDEVPEREEWEKTKNMLYDGAWRRILPDNNQEIPPSDEWHTRDCVHQSWFRF